MWQPFRAELFAVRRRADTSGWLPALRRIVRAEMPNVELVWRPEDKIWCSLVTMNGVRRSLQDLPVAEQYARLKYANDDRLARLIDCFPRRVEPKVTTVTAHTSHDGSMRKVSANLTTERLLPEHRVLVGTLERALPDLSYHTVNLQRPHLGIVSTADSGAADELSEIIATNMPERITFGRADLAFMTPKFSAYSPMESENMLEAA
jgi:hypothetical protein